MQQLYQVEERSIKQTEDSIERFKDYAKLQVKHRVEIYHKSRRQLEVNARFYADEHH